MSDDASGEAVLDRVRHEHVHAGREALVLRRGEREGGALCADRGQGGPPCVVEPERRDDAVERRQRDGEPAPAVDPDGLAAGRPVAQRIEHMRSLSLDDGGAQGLHVGLLRELGLAREQRARLGATAVLRRGFLELALQESIDRHVHEVPERTSRREPARGGRRLHDRSRWRDRSDRARLHRAGLLRRRR